MSAARLTTDDPQADAQSSAATPLAVRALESSPRATSLRRAPLAWVEVPFGRGGLAWLAAWTLLQLESDPLGRPALWIDTHRTLTADGLADLAGRVVVVRPDDPHEAHAAAEIALRAGSFSFVALEMHRALHPTPLARLARLASARRGVGRTQIVLWGEPPAFVSPPNRAPRYGLADAVAALFEAVGAPPIGDGRSQDAARALAVHPSERGHVDVTTEPTFDVHANRPDRADGAALRRSPDAERASLDAVARGVRALERSGDRSSFAKVPAISGDRVDDPREPAPPRGRTATARDRAPVARWLAAFPRRPDFA